MTKKLYYLDISIIIIGALSLFGLIHTSNDKERYLRVLATTEIQEAGIIKDQMWEVVAKETQIQKESFDSIYPEIMEKPTSNTTLDLIQKYTFKLNKTQKENLMISIKVFKKRMTQQQVDIETAIDEHTKLVTDPFYALYIRDDSPINYNYLVIAE